jgi:hypothetical protein
MDGVACEFEVAGIVFSRMSTVRKERVHAAARMDAGESVALRACGVARACARSASAPEQATRSRLIRQVGRHAPAREPAVHGGQLRSRSIHQVSATRLHGARNARGAGTRPGVHSADTIRTGGRPNRPLQQTNAPTIIYES